MHCGWVLQLKINWRHLLSVSALACSLCTSLDRVNVPFTTKSEGATLVAHMSSALAPLSHFKHLFPPPWLWKSSVWIWECRKVLIVGVAQLCFKLWITHFAVLSVCEDLEDSESQRRAGTSVSCDNDLTPRFLLKPSWINGFSWLKRWAEPEWNPAAFNFFSWSPFIYNRWKQIDHC